MHSRSTTGVLVSIKVLQLMGTVCCLVLHILQYTMGYITPHITVFCGTYMGFTLVNMSFLISAIMGKPAAEELDIALGVIGGILFYLCGILAMYFVRQNTSRYEGDDVYFNMARCMAMASLLTALIFVFDACLKFDMWNYERKKKKNKKAGEDNDPPPLRLFCVDIGHFCYKKCRCCKCCNACCEKFCKCCRRKGDDSQSVASAASRASQTSKGNAPTITVEKYRDSGAPNDKVVVQRVEIEWDSKPVMYPKSPEDIQESSAENNKQLRNESDLTKTPSFFATQKLTWPLPFHSLIPSELSLRGMQRIAKTSRMVQVWSRKKPTSSCSTQHPISEAVIPMVSLEPEEVTGEQRSQPMPSTTLLMPGGIQEGENNVEEKHFATISKENISPEHASASSSSQGSMIVRSRSTKKQ